MTRGWSPSRRKGRESGGSWDRSIHGNRLPVPLEIATIWDPDGPPAAYPFGHRHFTGQGSSIVVHKNTQRPKGKVNNAQSVTCVHKLSLGHMSIFKKFSEPNSRSAVLATHVDLQTDCALGAVTMQLKETSVINVTSSMRGPREPGDRHI